MPVIERTALMLLAGIAAVSIAACGSAGHDATDPVPQNVTSPVDQGAAPFSVPGQLTAVNVTSFELTQGQSAWAAGEEREVAGSSWFFGESGSFSWTTADTADMSQDLLPVTGRYTASADRIEFHGEHTVTSSVGSRTVIVDGTVRIDSGDYQVTMRMTSTSGTGAVVDGQQFAQANGAANESTIEASAS